MEVLLQVQQLNQTQDVIPMHVEVLVGPLLSEIRQTFDDNTQLTTRQAYSRCAASTRVLGIAQVQCLSMQVAARVECS